MNRNECDYLLFFGRLVSCVERRPLSLPLKKCQFVRCRLSASHEHVVPVRLQRVPVAAVRGVSVGARKLQKVRRAVALVVKLLRVRQPERVLHSRRVLDALEVVVPRAPVRDHVVPQEAVAQKHLHLLVVPRREPARVSARVVLVRAAPLVPAGRELVRRQRTRPRRERARQHDAGFAVPRFVLLQNARVRDDIRGRQMRRLVRLRVQPPERL
mmetsp:Transcript_4373/g.18631  ORF Transcript_4373/g.18631 Transcript_4373/m.18631 type:complete len:213 (+) Transcript_4373:827-1465(+)